MKRLLSNHVRAFGLALLAAALPACGSQVEPNYLGHADRRALHLGDAQLPLQELELLVRGSAAHFRVLLLDACGSGAITRHKGGSPAPAFPVQFDESLAGQEVAFLTSSSASEDAQESDELGGSFFSHYFVSGLMGAADADQDDRIDLEEAYRYAYDATLRAISRTWAGTQHPTFRFELGGNTSTKPTSRVTTGRSQACEIRTSPPTSYSAVGPSWLRQSFTTIVLSEPRRSTRRAELQFPGGRDYLVLRGSESGPVTWDSPGARCARDAEQCRSESDLRARIWCSRDCGCSCGNVRVPPDGQRNA